MLSRNFLFALFFCALSQAGHVIGGEVGTVEVSTWGMQKSLGYKARTDQYALATDIRPAK